MRIKLISPQLFLQLRWIIFIAILQASCALLLAFSVKSLLDSGDNNHTNLWMTIALGALCLASFLKWQERIQAEKVGQAYVHDIRKTLFDHLSRLSYRSFHQQRKGPLLLRFMNDLTALRQWISIGLSRLLVAGIVILTSLPALWIIHPQLGLLISLVLITGIILALVQGKSLNLSVRKARKRRAAMASLITEKLMMVDVIQRLTARQIERRNVLKFSKRLVQAMQDRADHIGRLRSLTLLVGNLTIILLASASHIFGTQISLTKGEILASLTIISFLTPALYDLGRVYEYWHSARIAAEKVELLLNKGHLISAPQKGTRKQVKSAHLRIKNLEFSQIFRQLDLNVRPGRKVLITGKNGSGKSTLLRMIMRLDEPDNGEISLGRVPICRLGLGNLRRAVTLVSNDDPLIKGTIAENLAYPNRPHFSSDDLKPLSVLSLDISNKKSPFYAFRKVTEFGKNLSQGEKALLLMGRALLRQPQILLIDEIDVHLDHIQKKRFFKMIKAFDGTVIFISHNSSVSRYFDRHYELSAGQLYRVESKADVKPKIKLFNPQLKEVS